MINIETIAIVVLILKFDAINLNYHDIDNKIGILHITSYVYNYSPLNCMKMCMTAY